MPLTRTLTVRQLNICRNEANTTADDLLLVVRGRFQRNNSWKLADRMAMLDSILRGYQCAPVYFIISELEKKEFVFDGAHRIETVCDFVENKWPIEKCNSESLVWENSYLSGYDKMYFRDLDPDVKRVFRDYQFVINTIDQKIASNPDELATLWVRLNNSGNSLNDYEMYIPVYFTLYEFLENNSKPWFNTWVYKKETSERGEVSVQMMRLLALSEQTYPDQFSSQLDIYKRWRRSKFGNTLDVEKNVEILKPELAERLKLLHSVYNKIESSVSEYVHNPVILFALIGRIARWTKNTATLNRNEAQLMEYCKLMLETPRRNHQVRHDAPSANAGYQLKILEEIDRDVRDIIERMKDPRLFTPTQRMNKLLEQKGVCPYCQGRITSNDVCEGHHVKPYSQGGPTTMENCQVLHKDCHKKLHAKDGLA